MTDLTHCTLDDVLELQRGHDLPATIRGSGNVPVIGSFGITGFHDVAKYAGPGVAIGRSGSIGVATYCASEYWPLNTCLFVKDFHGNDPRWVFYLLDSIDFSGFNSGSAVPSLNRNYLKSIPVVLPEMAEQRAIAGLLGALDDKINSNRRIQELLFCYIDGFCKSEQARDSMEVVELRSLLQFNYGKSLPKPAREPGRFPVVGSGGVDGFHASNFVLAPVVVVGRAGQPGRVHLVLEDCWPIDSAFWISPIRPLPVAWIWSALSSLDLSRLQSGSAVPGLNREIALSEKVMVPNQTALEMIQTVTDPMVTKIRRIDVETTLVVQLRNFLLPELLSGRLRVKVGESMMENM